MTGSLSTRSITEFLGRVHDAGPDESTPSSICFEAIGRRWQELGVRPGDLVLLCLPNGHGLLDQFFGVVNAGAIPALMAPGTLSARLRDLARVLGARAVGALHLPASVADVERETIGAMQVGLWAEAAAPVGNPGEVVLLTSGTSGFASGCVLAMDDLLLNAERHADSIGQRGDDTILVSLPLHFSFALVAQALATLVRGGRLVIGGPPFHAGAYLKTLSRYEVTVSSLTPVLVRSLLSVDRLPPVALRALTVGGDVLATEQVARLLAWRHGRELYVTYGLTEVGPRVSTLAVHDEPRHRHTSVGRPLAGTTVSLQDTGDGSGLKQLLVSSKTVMKRRIGLIEGRPRCDGAPPGTVATGDVFEQDSDGYLYFQGRLTDFIIRRGEKICLAAVRRIALQIPQVVGAKTQLLRQVDGDADYELILTTANRDSLPAEEYTSKLRRLLRRAEMPSSVRINADDPAESVRYK